MKRIAMISGWHVHAKGYAKLLAADPRCELAAVWDEDAARGEAWALELGVPFVADLDALLADDTIDGVAVDSPTNQHRDVLIRCAKAGKAIFTEKVLAATAAEACEVRDAILASGKPFAISFPHLCWPKVRAIGQMVQNGDLGRITYARVRNVHDGSIRDWLPPHFYDAQACCGGAMIDLGAHPMYTLDYLLGQPADAVSLFTEVTNRGVEDNAVTTMAFAGGAIGVAETGFVSAFNPYTLEVSGTAGCAMVHGDSVRYANAATEGKWVDAQNLPEALPYPIIQWLDSLETGVQVPNMDIDSAVRLSEMMDMAYGRE